MPTPTPLPYDFSTPVAALYTGLLDPSSGAPGAFTAEAGALLAGFLALLWLAYLLRRYVYPQRF